MGRTMASQHRPGAGLGARAFSRYGASSLSRRLQQAGFGFVAEGTLRETYQGRAGRNPNAPAKVTRRYAIDAFLASKAHRVALQQTPPAILSRQRAQRVHDLNPLDRWSNGRLTIGHFQQPPDAAPDDRWQLLQLQDIEAVLKATEQKWSRQSYYVAIYGQFAMEGTGPAEGSGGVIGESDRIFGLAQAGLLPTLDLDLEESGYELPYITVTQLLPRQALDEALIAAKALQETRLGAYRGSLNPTDRQFVNRRRREIREEAAAEFARVAGGGAWVELYGMAMWPPRHGDTGRAGQ